MECEMEIFSREGSGQADFHLHPQKKLEPVFCASRAGRLISSCCPEHCAKDNR